MTNTATTTTHQFDPFCDCTPCAAQLQADLAAVNANLPTPTIPDFADQTDTTEAPAPATAPCLRCGRTLRTAKSIATGYGPTCAAKIHAAEAASDAKPDQLAKAVEAIETGAVVPLPRKGTRVFSVVSSKGDRHYLTTPTGHCTCTAGLHGRRCFHVLAAQLIAA